MGQAPSYTQRAQKLIEKVKEMFNSISVEDGVLITPLNDLISRLSVVDSIERLGIDRHFKTEIKSALDYVYRSVIIVALLSLFFYGIIHMIITRNYFHLQLLERERHWMWKRKCRH